MDRAQREHRVTKSRSIMLWRGVLRAGVGLRGKRSRNKRHYTSDRSIKWPHAAHGELDLVQRGVSLPACSIVLRVECRVDDRVP